MKRKFVPRFHFWCPKMSFRNEVVWLIYLKRAVKYQCPDFPWHATLDVPRPWFLLTRRDIGVRNMTPYDTSRSLTRRVPIHDSPSVEEYHGPVNSTKLLISRSETLHQWNQRYLHMWRYHIFTREDIVSFLSICYHSLCHWLLYNKVVYMMLLTSSRGIMNIVWDLNSSDIFVPRPSITVLWSQRITLMRQKTPRL